MSEDFLGVANEERGEIDIVLEGQRFVLRPSYEAVLVVERKLGKGLMLLAADADAQTMPLDEAKVVATAFIVAWGRATDNVSARAVTQDNVGRLIYDAGYLALLPRIAHVLSLAATGGCLPSGELKAPTEMKIPEIPGGASQE